jgi:hypothetical protein
MEVLALIQATNSYFTGEYPNQEKNCVEIGAPAKMAGRAIQSDFVQEEASVTCNDEELNEELDRAVRVSGEDLPNGKERRINSSTGQKGRSYSPSM